MSSKNQVTLTFAGETKDVESAFNRVGESSKEMSDKVAESGEGFNRAAEASDKFDEKVYGLHDALTGLQDTGTSVKDFMKGDFSNGLLFATSGLSDLGSAGYHTVVPMFGKLATAIKGSTIATKAAGAATKVWTGIQAVFNAVMDANPIALIAIAIIALIVVIVLIATKTHWFQDLWRAAWKGIKAAAQAVWNWLKQVPGWLKSAFSKVGEWVSAPYRTAFRIARSVASDAWNFIKGIPGKLKSAFSRVAGFVSAPFRAGFNTVASAWNATVGKLSWKVPSWVPGIGGDSISAPTLPHFHTGGVVPGAPGTETLAVVQAGERINALRATGGAAAGTTIELRSDGTRVSEMLLAILREAIDIRGGNVQVVMGR